MRLFNLLDFPRHQLVDIQCSIYLSLRPIERKWKNRNRKKGANERKNPLCMASHFTSAGILSEEYLFPPDTFTSHFCPRLRSILSRLHFQNSTVSGFDRSLVASRFDAFHLGRTVNEMDMRFAVPTPDAIKLSAQFIYLRKLWADRGDPWAEGRCRPRQRQPKGALNNEKNEIKIIVS